MSADGAPARLAPPISVLVLTKNEEQDLPACLDSVAWADDVHVFDSHSTDRTAEIAAARGARVTKRAFDDFASQRNAALHGLPFKHSWVLTLDADERVPPALVEALADFVRNPPVGIAACRMRRRDFLGGTWLRRAQTSPFYVRLVQPRKVRYEREVNEFVRVDGAIHDLAAPFDHYPFSKGMRHWLDKHNLYSTFEARCVLNTLSGKAPFSARKAFFARDFNERRFHQKALFYTLPLRPLVRFLYIYCWRRGFLDGAAGFTYAALQGIYEYMIVLKTRELRERSAATAQRGGRP